jgi:hypothetical protein
MPCGRGRPKSASDHQRNEGRPATTQHTDVMDHRRTEVWRGCLDLSIGGFRRWRQGSSNCVQRNAVTSNDLMRWGDESGRAVSLTQPRELARNDAAFSSRPPACDWAVGSTLRRCPMHPAASWIKIQSLASSASAMSWQLHNIGGALRFPFPIFHAVGQ